MVAALPRGLTSITFGSFMVERASCSICSDMVAENSSVCRLAGSRLSTLRIAGKNPMSSMRSASSSTSTSIIDRSIAPRSVRSSKRPGVATTIATPRRRSAICALMFAPPMTITLRLDLARFNSP